MKPTKNRIMCPDCRKPKMLFETERKANDFIKWNREDIEHGEKLRAYYCPSCCGWHISHQKHRRGYDFNTDKLINAYHRIGKPRRKIDKLIRHEEVSQTEQKLMVVAQRVYDDIPEELKATSQKGYIKRFLDDYLSKKNFSEYGGRLRAFVYKLFKDDMIQRFKRQ